jgi:hypothetical protein
MRIRIRIQQLKLIRIHADPDTNPKPCRLPTRLDDSLIKRIALGSVVDPHHVDADPDSTYHPDADPDSDFYLMWIRIRLLLDVDPYPTFHSDADPDPSFQKKAQTLEKFIK